ncbi:MAG: hypothetical protein WKG07_17590 [Hymenobacter sp.]
MFATLDRENHTFTDNPGRQSAFYRDAAPTRLWKPRPQALRAHARTCETGLDSGARLASLSGQTDG